MRTISSAPPEVPLVNRDKWKLMSFLELSEQRNIMNDRYYTLLDLKKLEQAKAIQAGIDELDELIQSKL